MMQRTDNITPDEVYQYLTPMLKMQQQPQPATIVSNEQKQRLDAKLGSLQIRDKKFRHKIIKNMESWHSKDENPLLAYENLYQYIYTFNQNQQKRNNEHKSIRNSALISLNQSQNMIAVPSISRIENKVPNLSSSQTQQKLNQAAFQLNHAISRSQNLISNENLPVNLIQSNHQINANSMLNIEETPATNKHLKFRKLSIAGMSTANINVQNQQPKTVQYFGNSEDTTQQKLLLFMDTFKNFELRSGEKIQNLLRRIIDIIKQIRQLKTERTILKFIYQQSFYNKKLYQMLADDLTGEIKYQDIINLEQLSIKYIDNNVSLKNGKNYVWKAERQINEGLMSLAQKLEEYFIKESREKINLVQENLIEQQESIDKSKLKIIRTLFLNQSSNRQMAENFQDFQRLSYKQNLQALDSNILNDINRIESKLGNFPYVSVISRGFSGDLNKAVFDLRLLKNGGNNK